MINSTNFGRLKLHLKRFPHQFDMTQWAGRSKINDQSIYVHCGTVMCIGGTAAYLMRREETLGEVSIRSVQDTSKYSVADWLGISEESTHHLFYMKDSWDMLVYGDYSKVTLEDALAVLEEVETTGECTRATWEKIAPHAFLEPRP